MSATTDEPQPPYVTCYGLDGRAVIEVDQFKALTVWLDIADADGERRRMRVRFDGKQSVELAKAIFGAAGLRETKKAKT